MTTTTPTTTPASAPTDAAAKRRIKLGAIVFVAGWVIGLGLVPLITASSLSSGLKATLGGLAVVAVPKIFLIIAIAIMGKPGFIYLKSLVFARIKPTQEVSQLRYNIGLVLLISMILLGNLGAYVHAGILPGRDIHPNLYAAAGDLLMVVSLFILGGNFWDKLAALFIRDAKVIFPTKD